MHVELIYIWGTNRASNMAMGWRSVESTRHSTNVPRLRLQPRCLSFMWVNLG